MGVYFSFELNVYILIKLHNDFPLRKSIVHLHSLFNLKKKKKHIVST